MMARVQSKLALRPFLSTDAPLLAEIFRASIEGLTADVSDSAQEFFKRRGFVAKQRNSVPLGNEWLANTTMEKRLAAKERAQ